MESPLLQNKKGAGRIVGKRRWKGEMRLRDLGAIPNDHIRSRSIRLACLVSGISTSRTSSVPSWLRTA